jgi:hypothetical protein
MEWTIKESGVTNRAGTFVLLAVVLSVASCRSLPWNIHSSKQTTLAFEFLRGQPVVKAEIGGIAGRFVVGSAHPRTLVRGRARANDVVSLGFRTAVRIDPRVAPLETTADGILAIDVWRETGTLTVDYARRVITIGGESPFADVPRERFEGAPAVSVLAAGIALRAIVDTSYPGGLIIPESQRSRFSGTQVDVELNGLRTSVPLLVAPVPEPRIGNALLRHYLVMIDYRAGIVAVWPDPRSAGYFAEGTRTTPRTRAK